MLTGLLRSSLGAASLSKASGVCGAQAGWRSLHSAWAASFAYDYYYDQAHAPQGPGSGLGNQNAAAAALDHGIASQIIEFQITPDEAIRRFHAYQAAACRGMHAHGLISRKDPTTVRSAYLPSWCFVCNITAEYKGQLGFKDDKSGQMVWKDMEDWRTLSHKQQLTYQEATYLQVYASYNYERSLGAGAMLPSSACLTAARPLQPEEAARLSAPAAAAATPSSILRPEQQGPATQQDPLSTVSSHGVSSFVQGVGAAGAGPTADGADGGERAAQGGSTGGGTADSGAQGTAGGAAGGSGAGSGTGGMRPGETAVHPPDMQQAIAWQLAYRGLVRQQTEKACAAALQSSGAIDTRDMHVVIQVHSLQASLLYLPTYVAHYQQGDRYKHGTSTCITPQMFYAAISGLEQGQVSAATHVSPQKAQAATATLMGGLGMAAGTGPTWMGMEPLLSLGTAESVLLAVIGALVAGMWAQGLPQALRNNITAEQIKAEREFYRQYDLRETKTAAAIAQAIAAAEAAGRAPPAMEAGEQADEYMQWLWMDQDWRRWEMDEPWNWDASKRRQAAEQIAARTVARRRERQQYLERLLEDRRKREYEQEQEWQRSQRGGRAPGSRSSRFTSDFTSDGTSVGSEVVRRRRDFLGYYRLMGLADAEDVTAEAIKTAFKGQAMLLHPDRVMASMASASAAASPSSPSGGTTTSSSASSSSGSTSSTSSSASSSGGSSSSITSSSASSESLQQEAHVRFQRLQIAYDVLRDPEKRRAYDRGQLVQ